MYRFCPVALSFAAEIFLLASSASSAELSLDPEGVYVALSGEIDEKTEGKLIDLFINRPGIELLVLDSPGGYVRPALNIALMVNRLGLSTLIPKNSSCASACSFIFLAGQERLAEGRLGVHQFYGGIGDATVVESETQFLVSEILDAFEIFGVDWRVSRAMLTTPPDSMFIFEDWQISDWGINEVAGEEALQGELPENSVSKFHDYPEEVTAASAEQIVLPDFDGRDAWARNYRTRIREGMLGGSNFAGHFALVEIGCGTSCRFAFVGNLLSGEVFSFPYGGEEQYEMDLLYLSESRLVKARWANYDLETCINQDLVFQDGDFVVVNEYVTPRITYCNDSSQP